MYLLDWEVGLYLYYFVVEILLVSLVSPYRYFAMMRHFGPNQGTFATLKDALFMGGLHLVVNLIPCFVVFAMAGQLIQGSNGRDHLMAFEAYLPILRDPIPFAILFVFVLWEQIQWRRQEKHKVDRYFHEFVRAMIFGWGGFLLILLISSFLPFRFLYEESPYSPLLAVWITCGVITSFEIAIFLRGEALDRFIKRVF